ncbi:hypothetical protein GOV06_04015 [Candidatus Woesearchaeota archaeon]|nr:hypothetical protein [Candidatus Woesearchaeota archaeon]
MYLGYKLRLAKTSDLSKDIQEKAVEIARSRVRIAKLNQKLKPSFEKLKKANIELTKFLSPKVKKTSKVRNMSAGKQQAAKELSAAIRLDIINILKEIDSIISDLKKVIFDADTMLYRQSRAIDRLHKEVDKLKDKKLSLKLANQLNILKEDMKSAARRLYELAKAPSLLKKSFKKKKIMVSTSILKLSIEAAQLDKILKKLSVNSIDEITKKAEKELDDLQKIEIVIISLVPNLKLHLTHIRNNLHLLDPSSALRAEDKLTRSEKYLEKTMAKITSQAEKLFEEIVIIKKI